MKIVIEICCDESFGELRQDKAEKALEVLARVVSEAQEHSGMLIDPLGQSKYDIYGPNQAVCGSITCKG